MGYKLIYGPTRGNVTRRRRKWPFVVMSGFFFALFCALAQHYLQAEIQMIYNSLLPNAPIDVLIQDLQEGESILQAVAAFCEDMLHGR